MVEKFKFVLLEYYCCGLWYPSHFYCGSLQGVFTLANILQYLYNYSYKWYPWKGNSQQQCSACWLYHLLMWIHVSLITEKRNRFWKFLKLSFFHCPDQYFMSKTKEKKEKVCSTILLVKEKNYSHLSWKMLLPDECGHF